MSLSARATTGFAFSIIMALALAVVSLVSFFIMLEYIREDSVSLGFGTLPCCLLIAFISFCILILCSILNITTAVSVSKRSKSKPSLRSFWIFVLYPIALISFIIPSFEEGFFTSLIFGFPLFVSGVILIPFSSFTVLREALKLDKKVYRVEACRYCQFLFRRELRQEDGVCPRCGAYHQFVVLGDPEQKRPMKKKLKKEPEVTWDTTNK